MRKNWSVEIYGLFLWIRAAAQNCHRFTVEASCPETAYSLNTFRHNIWTDSTVNGAAVVLSSSPVHSSLSPSVSYLTVGFLWPFPSLPLDWNFLQVLADSTEFSGTQKCPYSITIIVFPKYNEGTGLGCIVAERFRQLGYWYNESYDTGCPLCALSVFISLCLSLQMDSPIGVWLAALWQMRTRSWASATAFHSQV